jgi:hypothetical protein
MIEHTKSSIIEIVFAQTSITWNNKQVIETSEVDTKLAPVNLGPINFVCR